MTGVVGLLFFAYACRGGRAMMSVGDIERRHLSSEEFGDARHDGIVVDNPEFVSEIVLVRKLVLRRSGDGLFDYSIDFRIVLVGKENGLYVRILDAHVHHAVVLLVLAGKFVLLDESVRIVSGMGTEHYSVLGAAVHSLCIHIVAGFGVAHQPAALLPELEVLDSLVVGALFVLPCDGLEVDFGLGNVQQALFSRHRLSFCGIQHIVRRCRDFRHQILGRPDGLEGFDCYHTLTCLPGTWYFLLRNNPRSALQLQDRR